MRFYFSVILVFIYVSLLGQGNASVGLELGYLVHEDVEGPYLGTDIRYQFSNRIGWQTEVGVGFDKNKTITTTESVVIIDFETSTFLTSEEQNETLIYLKSGVAMKFLNISNLFGELHLGGGLLKEDPYIEGFGYGKLFLSAKVSDHVVVGLPISFNYIFWSQENFYSAGLAIRYQY